MTTSGSRAPLDTAAQLRAALVSDDGGLIALALLRICVYPAEYEALISALKRSGRHPNASVRSAALIAMIHGELCHDKFDLPLAADLIERGLNDDDDLVKANAMDALDFFEGVNEFPPPGYEHLLDFAGELDDDDVPPTGQK